MAIVVTKNHKDAKRIEPMMFEGERLESFMQDYVLANPEMIPLDQVTGKKWHIVAKELDVSHGTIDLLGIDQEGSIYAIETKRKKNPDSREVIAQLLDYAASLWGDYAENPTLFWNAVEANASSKKINLNQRLSELSSCEPPDANNDETEETDQYRLIKLRRKVEEKLCKGDFVLVTVTDKLQKNIKAAIRFLNECSGFTVLGVELEYYEYDIHTDQGDQRIEIVVPTTYGEEAWGKREQARSRAAGIVWDRDKFLSALAERVSAKAADAARDIVNWCENKFKEAACWTEAGSFRISFIQEGRSLPPFHMKTDGRIQINMPMGSPFCTRELRIFYRNILNKIDGVNIPEEALNEARYPLFDIEKLSTLEARAKFREAIVWWAEQLKSTRTQASEPRQDII